MPEHRYGLAVVVLLCLGGSALAGRLASAWRGPGFARIYLAVLAVTAASGLAVLDAGVLVGSPTAWLVSAVCGPAAAVLAVAADRWVLRWARRRHHTPAPPPRAARPRAVVLGGRPEPPPRAGPDDQHGFTSPTVLGCAVLEEVNHRGWLLQACLLLPPVAAGGAVAAALVGFAVIHVPFGWPHVLAKGLLGILALAAVLVSGSVLAAVLAHTLFNAEVWARRTTWP